MEEVYRVEKPNSETGAQIYEKIIRSAKENDLDPNVALRIAKCESNIRQHGTDGELLRGRENAKDLGIFQINEKYHLSRSQSLGLNINQTDGNIAYAMWLLKKEGTKPWNWSKPCWGNENYLKTNV